jgi:hypothetical protein
LVPQNPTHLLRTAAATISRGRRAASIRGTGSLHRRIEGLTGNHTTGSGMAKSSPWTVRRCPGWTSASRVVSQNAIHLTGARGGVLWWAGCFSEPRLEGCIIGGWIDAGRADDSLTQLKSTPWNVR